MSRAWSGSSSPRRRPRERRELDLTRTRGPGLRSRPLAGIRRRAGRGSGGCGICNGARASRAELGGPWGGPFADPANPVAQPMTALSIPPPSPRTGSSRATSICGSPRSPGAGPNACSGSPVTSSGSRISPGFSRCRRPSGATAGAATIGHGVGHRCRYGPFPRAARRANGRERPGVLPHRWFEPDLDPLRPLSGARESPSSGTSDVGRDVPANQRVLQEDRDHGTGWCGR